MNQSHKKKVVKQILNPSQNYKVKVRIKGKV